MLERGHAQAINQISRQLACEGYESGCGVFSSLLAPIRQLGRRIAEAAGVGFAFTLAFQPFTEGFGKIEFLLSH